MNNSFLKNKNTKNFNKNGLVNVFQQKCPDFYKKVIDISQVDVSTYINYYFYKPVQKRLPLVACMPNIVDFYLTLNKKQLCLLILEIILKSSTLRDTGSPVSTIRLLINNKLKFIESYAVLDLYFNLSCGNTDP